MKRRDILKGLLLAGLGAARLIPPQKEEKTIEKPKRVFVGKAAPYFSGGQNV